MSHVGAPPPPHAKSTTRERYWQVRPTSYAMPRHRPLIPCLDKRTAIFEGLCKLSHERSESVCRRQQPSCWQRAERV